MNTRQGKHLPVLRLETYTDPARRHCACPHPGCAFVASVARRGPGANALGAAMRVKSAVIRHYNAAHSPKGAPP